MSQISKSALSKIAPASRPKLQTREAAAYLGVSASMLTKLRSTHGGGPDYIKIGRRCVYDVYDLEAWAAALKRRSTPEI